MVTVLEHGYEAEYEKLTSSFSEPLSEEDCLFVIDVLTMNRAFEWAMKKGVEIPVEDDYLFSYQGFDGNEETAFYGYAQFLVDRPHSWDDFKSKDRNSHSNVVPQYRRMVKAWEQSANKYELAAGDFARIAEAARSY